MYGGTGSIPVPGSPGIKNGPKINYIIIIPIFNVIVVF